MKRKPGVKRVRITIAVVILLPILIWIAGGPGARFYISRNGASIIADIARRSDENIRVGSISGDLWSGVTGKRVVIYADKDPAHLPLLSADTVHVKFSILDLFRLRLNPVRVHMDGFTVALHVAPDGSVALPEWSIRSAGDDGRAIRAGYAAGSSSKSISVTCTDGTLEIHKRFPTLPESVDIVFTRLEGEGEYVPEDGLRIGNIHGKYLASDVSVQGYVPADRDEAVDLTATINQVILGSFFRDIDPLFRGNAYLPSGTAGGEFRLAGPREQLEVAGSMDLADSIFGNAKIDHAAAQVAYSAGVIDLNQISIEAYGGRADATGRINLLTEVPIWSAVCSFSDLNVGDYLDSNGYYSYEMSGDFSGSLEARGDFANPDALACTVEIQCMGGSYRNPFSERFMSMPPRMLEITPVTDEDLVGFDELIVNARIEDSSINVERFHFVSHELQVEATGAIGFDKSISASGGLSVPLDRARQHPRFGRYVRLLPDSLQRASLEFSVSGWLYDVQFSARPTENLLRGLLDQGGDLLHDLGESLEGLDGR